MAIARQRRTRFSPDLSLNLVAALLVILWLAGGASREDAAGQVVSRAASWLTIVVAVLFARAPRIREAKGTALILGGAIALCLVQLVPLPPGMWRALPGREAFADPLVSSPDLWRPWSLVPGTTVNALFSLIVPVAVLVLVTGIREEQERWVLSIIMTVIGLALLVGLLQFTGASVMNPLVNGEPGAVDGLIANRNHFALLLAIGLLIAPIWGVGGTTASRVRAPIALGLVLLLVLTVLASGSRAGMMLGGLALVLGCVIARRGVKSALRRYPRWTLPALVLGIVALIGIFVIASVAADRAVSINRLVALDLGEDDRHRALPAVLAITRSYLPFGTGMGSFDQVFRMHEPFALLEPYYLNHAHNDFFEIVLNAGLPGLMLLAAAIAWWGWRSASAWRRDAALPKLGSAMLLLVLLASIVDYPARTPIFLALTTIAAIWLGGTGRNSGAAGEAALPSDGRGL